MHRGRRDALRPVADGHVDRGRPGRRRRAPADHGPDEDDRHQHDEDRQDPPDDLDGGDEAHPAGHAQDRHLVADPEGDTRQRLVVHEGASDRAGRPGIAGSRRDPPVRSAGEMAGYPRRRTQARRSAAGRRLTSPLAGQRPIRPRRFLVESASCSLGWTVELRHGEAIDDEGTPARRSGRRAAAVPALPRRRLLPGVGRNRSTGRRGPRSGRRVVGRARDHLRLRRVRIRALVLRRRGRWPRADRGRPDRRGRRGLGGERAAGRGRRAGRGNRGLGGERGAGRSAGLPGVRPANPRR